jgi:hypothetical protein
VAIRTRTLDTVVRGGHQTQVNLQFLFSIRLLTSNFGPLGQNWGLLEVATALERLEHGDFIGILQIRPNRNSDADARDSHAQWFQQFR